jgi:L-arabinose isomerase
MAGPLTPVVDARLRHRPQFNAKSLFTEWTANGPAHDCLSLIGGILVRETDFPSKVTVRYVVPNEMEREVLILKVRDTDW